MAKITLTINNRLVSGEEGESILAIARANNIYIPAICYLTRCSPTLACRLCMVEADGKRVYSCNAKAKDNMAVVTSTPEMEAEREEIMRVYCVNHPLQCGVCDKSGECELQNNTLYQRVSKQVLAIKDTDRKAVKWGAINYDPALCVVCERCVTVCKDMIGAAALAATARGGDAIGENYKASMPKDAYAVWNKLNKSLIGRSAKGDLCEECGECAAVCPTGAMISAGFQYKSNAWELRKIPSACVNCPSACGLFYEVKQTSIGDSAEKIYRVSNDFHFESLCAAGRFGYYEGSAARKDRAKFDRAAAALKKAKAVRFTSKISNEEILVLNRVKKLMNIKLINEEARAFAAFLKTFSEFSGRSLYSGKKGDIGDFIVSIGVRLSSANPSLRYAINNSAVVKKGAAVYFHPLGDPIMDSMHKNVAVARQAVGGEEITIAKLLNRFAPDLPPEAKEKIGGFVFDGEEIERIDKLSENKSAFTIVAGSDLFEHPRSANIAAMLGLLERFSPFKVILSPKYVNSLGAALFAELDGGGDIQDEAIVGYNAEGGFKLSDFEEGDNVLPMPALSRQEGTIVTIDKKIAPINAALPYDGYALGDLYAALGGEEIENIADLTSEIAARGFDSLKDGSREDLPVRELSAARSDIETPRSEAETEANLYVSPPLSRSDDGYLIAGGEFLSGRSLENGSEAIVDIGGERFSAKVRADNAIGGNFALFYKDMGGFPFKTAKIIKG